MSDMTACLNDLSYIPLNNEQNEPTQGDIGETSNDPTQAKRNEFEELYASANEELYPGCEYVTRLDFMAKFTYFKVKVHCQRKWDLGMILESVTGAREVKMNHPVMVEHGGLDTRVFGFCAEPRKFELGLAADGVQSVQATLALSSYESDGIYRPSMISCSKCLSGWEWEGYKAGMRLHVYEGHPSEWVLGQITPYVGHRRFL
ncbi:hypothetical protein Tco_0195934 [Tanacetum coccineum]